MEDRETARMRKYGESKTTRIMMANLPHVTSGSGLRKFQTDGFLFDKSVRNLWARTWLEICCLEKTIRCVLYTTWWIQFQSTQLCFTLH